MNAIELLEKAELLAKKLGSDIFATWEAFELFVEKEIGVAKAEPANDPAPVEPPTTPPAA